MWSDEVKRDEGFVAVVVVALDVALARERGCANRDDSDGHAHRRRDPLQASAYADGWFPAGRSHPQPLLSACALDLLGEREMSNCSSHRLETALLTVGQAMCSVADNQ